MLALLGQYSIQNIPWNAKEVFQVVWVYFLRRHSKEESIRKNMQGRNRKKKKMDVVPVNMEILQEEISLATTTTDHYHCTVALGAHLSICSDKRSV